MKLYGSTNRRSFNTFKLRVALNETGAAYEFAPVDLAKGEQRTPAFLAINPHAKVPVLVDGDFALPESDAILWYIAEKFPEAKLLPRADGNLATTQARARILQWCDFASTGLYAAYADYYNYALGEEAKRIAWAAEGAQQKIARATGVMETILADRPFVAGGFSIADIANAAILASIKLRLPGDPLADRPRTAAWYEKVTARPSWTKALETP